MTPKESPSPHDEAPLTSPRSIVFNYNDPLEIIWEQTAAKLGITIARSHEVYASWDGEGTLRLGATEHLDADDSMAQMILHELCHALIEGEHAYGERDWGLCNEDDRHAVRELAAMRLQAALLSPLGLRRVLAVTTDWRALYDALPDDPLEGDEEAARLARHGFERAMTGPWAEAIAEALQATAAIAEIAAPFAKPGSLWSTAGPRKR